MIRLSDTTHIWYTNTLILKIVGHDTWYMHIEKYTIYFKKKHEKYMIVLCESKLKSNIFNIKIYKLLSS